jgi:hypothetical protein
MGFLNSCPVFFSKGNGERLSLRQELLPQKIMLTATKSELLIFIRARPLNYRFYTLKENML